MRKEIIPAVVMPWVNGMWFGNVAKLGHIAVIMTCTTSPPLAVWIANQNMAKITLDMMATVCTSEGVNQEAMSGPFCTIRAPETPTCARKYRERGMIQHANGTIERNHNADGEERRSHDPNCILVAQPNRQH